MRQYRVDLFNADLKHTASFECQNPTSGLRYDYLTNDKTTLVTSGEPYINRGDFAIIYIDNVRSFDGRVEDYDMNEKVQTTVTILPLLHSLLNVDIYADVSDLNSNKVTIPEFMTSQIKALYSSVDEVQAIHDLEFEDNGLTTVGSVEVTADSIYNLYDLAVYFFKTYGFIIDFKLKPNAGKLLISYREIHEYKFHPLQVSISDIVKYDFNNNNTTNKPNKITYYNTDYYNAASYVEYLKANIRTLTDFEKDKRASIMSNFSSLNSLLDLQNKDATNYQMEAKIQEEDSTTIQKSNSYKRQYENKDTGVLKDIQVSENLQYSTYNEADPTKNKLKSSTIKIDFTETHKNLSPQKPDEVSIETTTETETSDSTDENGKHTVSVKESKNESRTTKSTYLSGSTKTVSKETSYTKQTNKTTGAWSSTKTVTEKTDTRDSVGNTETHTEETTENRSYDPKTNQTTTTDTYEAPEGTEYNNPEKYTVESKITDEKTEKLDDGKTTVTTTNSTTTSKDKLTGKQVATSVVHTVKKTNNGSPKKEAEKTISHSLKCSIQIKTNENSNVTITASTTTNDETSIEDDDNSTKTKTEIKMEGTSKYDKTFIYKYILNDNNTVRDAWYDQVYDAVDTTKDYTKTTTTSTDVSNKISGKTDSSNNTETYKHVANTNTTTITNIAPEEPVDNSKYTLTITKTVTNHDNNTQTKSYPTFAEYMEEVESVMKDLQVSITYYWHPSNDVMGGGTIDSDPNPSKRVRPVYYKVKTKTATAEEKDSDGNVTKAAKTFAEAAYDDAKDEMYTDRYDSYILIDMDSNTKLFYQGTIGDLYLITINDFKYPTILTGIYYLNEHEVEMTFGMMRQTLTQRLKNFIRKNR